MGFSSVALDRENNDCGSPAISGCADTLVASFSEVCEEPRCVVAKQNTESRFTRDETARKRSCRQSVSIDWWIPSEIGAISPLVDRLMRVIRESRCRLKDEIDVELAIREALGPGCRGNRQ